MKWLPAKNLVSVQRFTPHFLLETNTLNGFAENVDAAQFELLCKDGQRKPLSEYRSCTWGLVPSHAIVTSSARSIEERKHYQLFLAKAVQLYSSKPIANVTTDDRRYEGYNKFDTHTDDKYYSNPKQGQGQGQNYDPYGSDYNNRFNNPYDTSPKFGNLDSSFTTDRNRLGIQDLNGTQLYEKFDIFESERYGGRLNLMFQDAARNLVPIKETDQSFSGYLGNSLNQIYEVRHCPVGRMTLCVTSDPEMEKCVKMRVNNNEKLYFLMNIG